MILTCSKAPPRRKSQRAGLVMAAVAVFNLLDASVLENVAFGKDAAAGLRAVLVPRVPTAAQLARVGELDALGVAGTARALAPDAMREELAEVRALFAQLRPRVTHYKCCSTFDSAPTVGNLAVGLHALAQVALCDIRKDE